MSLSPERSKEDEDHDEEDIEEEEEEEEEEKTKKSFCLLPPRMSWKENIDMDELLLMK